MRKQTKLVAVLSTAALLAIGASMTSFAATGWAEEDGTWVYYDRNGDRVTDKWAKSGNNWYYLDGSGEMAIDQLIEDDDNYYYVDVNGVMVTNQWVAIENEDAGNDNEPDEWWYYFQANGKALKGPEDNTVSLKTVNGKKYPFTSEGKMLYGWVDAEDAAIINDDDDAWQRGDYYFGDQNDGAMTVGWKLIDITDDAATEDTAGNNWIQTAYNDDEDQSRWFWFKSNGKKQTASSGELELKAKTINGKKYAFDEYGRMVAEWAVDFDEAENNYKNDNLGTKTKSDLSDITANEGDYQWSRSWMYFNSVEDGARVAKNWFKVVPAEGLNQSKYNDEEDGWYYADGNGHLYASEFKTIKGKKYAFDSKGKMVSGLKFIRETPDESTTNSSDGLDIIADDHKTHPFDTESDFDKNSIYWANQGYRCYYFGNGEDGAMKTGRQQVDIDGDKYFFNFGESGSKKGAGEIGEDNKKYYNSGKLMASGSDEKYQVIYPVAVESDEVATLNSNSKANGYRKYEDSFDFAEKVANDGDVKVLDDITVIAGTEATPGGVVDDTLIKKCGMNPDKLRKGEYDDVNIFLTKATGSKFDVTIGSEKYTLGLKEENYMVVNTTGSVSKSSAKNKDGNDVYYKLYNDKIVSTFSEN